MSEFKFKVRKPKPTARIGVKAKAQKLPVATDGPPWIVQGMDATSIEYNVAKALEQLGLGYDFQYGINYGRERAGGSVIDFLIYTPGKRTLLDVQGRYWHTGAHSDELQEMRNKQTTSHWAVYLQIWEEDCLTIGDAISWLRQELYM